MVNDIKGDVICSNVYGVISLIFFHSEEANLAYNRSSFQIMTPPFWRALNNFGVLSFDASLTTRTHVVKKKLKICDNSLVFSNKDAPIRKK